MFKGYLKNEFPKEHLTLTKEDWTNSLNRMNIDFAKPVVTLLIDNKSESIKKRIENIKKPITDLDKYIYKVLKSSVDV